MEAKKEGELQGALDAHAQAAKQFREAAVFLKDRNGTFWDFSIGTRAHFAVLTLFFFGTMTDSVHGEFTTTVESNASKVCLSPKTNCRTTSCPTLFRFQEFSS